MPASPPADTIAKIRPPTVAPASSRVRLSLRAGMVDEHIDQVIAALSRYSGRKVSELSE